MSENKKYREITHPVLQHKLAMLRDKNTHGIGFRGLMNELGKFLAYEASRDFETVDFAVETPITNAVGKKPRQYPIVVSIMRAGNGMLDGVLETLPHASAGHIGIYRDKFIKNTVEYYFKLPAQSKGKNVLLLDPMLATADTAIASVDRLKQYEVGKITLLCVLASPEGLERLSHFHPDVEVVCLSVEEGLNEQGYLLPGLGDAGDRLYNSHK
ncbi:MAG: uracil phosphoribosyltransferase [Bacteriovoracaceae bacterium]